MKRQKKWPPTGKQGTTLDSNYGTAAPYLIADSAATVEARHA